MKNIISYIKDVFVLIGIPTIGILIIYFYNVQTSSYQAQIESQKSVIALLKEELNSAEEFKYDKAHSLISSLKNLHKEELKITQKQKEAIEKKLSDNERTLQDSGSNYLSRHATYLSILDIYKRFGVDLEVFFYSDYDEHISNDGDDTIMEKVFDLYEMEDRILISQYELNKSKLELAFSQIELASSQKEFLELESTILKKIINIQQVELCKIKPNETYCKNYLKLIKEHRERFAKVDENEAETCATVAFILNETLCKTQTISFELLEKP